MHAHAQTSAGMNFLAGTLLRYLPEDQAFWKLADVVEVYLFEYFLETMLGVLVDQRVCAELLRLNFPNIVEHAVALQVDLALVATQWWASSLASLLLDHLERDRRLHGATESSAAGCSQLL
jgi:hypothetical protein